MIKPSLIDKLTPFFNIIVPYKRDNYFDKLSKNLSKFLDIEYKIHFLTDLPEEDLETYYRSADMFLLKDKIDERSIEKALKNLLPVIAIDITEIPDYVALYIDNEPVEKVSALISIIAKNRNLRRKIVKYQLDKTGLNPDIYIQIEGSFDSSYSLAIVNREIARALSKIYPNRVSLYSTDGYGDFEPDKNFLERNPDINNMYKLSKKAGHFPIVLRNPYPPRVYDMKGLINGMTSYGWEESEYPKEYLEDFNRYLDFLPVMSPFVKKLMIDNGINIPVYTVGVGVDHILTINSEKYPLKTKKSFKFLHISSCFPRKGIDILLDAYTSAFTKNDDVVLIIKTFPNPHNKVEELINYYQNKNKNYPEIELINKDIPESQIKYLYEKSDCFILPSRGEGFGMPAAEAMLLKKPVIATNYSGQTYFCNKETAFLVDYKFEKSKSHLAQPFSYWVTPKKNELIEKMLYVYKNINSEGVKKKVENAYNLIISKFKWEDVANRLISAVRDVENKPIFTDSKLTVGWISSWNSKCGIAKYSEFLIENFSDNIKVIKIANRIDKSEILDKNKEKDTYRVWNFGAVKDVDNIVNTIVKNNINAVVIQHHFAFFDTKTFGKLIKRLKSLKIPIFITFHSTGIDIPKLSLKNISEELNLADRVFVHSINDLNIMKDYGIVDNLTLFPHGISVKKPDLEFVEKLKESYNLKGKTIIGTFGFLRKHKGVIELIKAYTLLKREFPNLALLLLNSVYPTEDSREYLKECKRFIKNLDNNTRKDIVFITDFIPEEDIANYISLMDIVIYPYYDVNESSSSAVRYALSVKKPIVLTPAKIFEDVSDVAIFTDGYSPENISNTVRHILKNPSILKEKTKQIEKFVSIANWESISKRLESIIWFIGGMVYW